MYLAEIAFDALGEGAGGAGRSHNWRSAKVRSHRYHHREFAGLTWWEKAGRPQNWRRAETRSLSMRQGRGRAELAPRGNSEPEHASGEGGAGGRGGRIQ